MIYDGWPTNVADLDTADTIVFISDGMQWSPWTFTPERIAAIQKQIDRGCGFMIFHFATYIPFQFQREGLAWAGGYVEYDGPKHPQMYFTQKTLTSEVLFPSPDHPVLHGVKPFKVTDEFYYKATFVGGDLGITPLLRIPELPADPKAPCPDRLPVPRIRSPCGPTTVRPHPNARPPAAALERHSAIFTTTGKTTTTASLFSTPSRGALTLTFPKTA